MTRKKTKIAFIPDDVRRRATFKKRARGLMKKMNELSVLCGLELCAIIYSPFTTEPMLWPSNLGARCTIARFKNMPNVDQSKWMADQQSYLMERISKVEEKRKKQEQENRKKAIAQIMHRGLAGESIEHLSLMDLHDVFWMIELTQKNIDERILALRNHQQL